jgi:DNA gyrase subunit A
MTAKKGKLVACRVVGPQHELMIVSSEGVMIRVKANDISKLGRATQGVKIMNLAEGDTVKAMARMIARKKKAPKRRAGAGEAQAVLDLTMAGAEPEEADTVDVGGDEEFDESLLDE